MHEHQRGHLPRDTLHHGAAARGGRDQHRRDLLLPRLPRRLQVIAPMKIVIIIIFDYKSNNNQNQNYKIIMRTVIRGDGPGDLATDIDSCGSSSSKVVLAAEQYW